MSVVEETNIDIMISLLVASIHELYSFIYHQVETKSHVILKKMQKKGGNSAFVIIRFRFILKNAINAGLVLFFFFIQTSDQLLC